MCGRYTITSSARELILRFRAELLDAAIEALRVPRYNAAPTQLLPVVISESRRSIDAMRWGLIPRWARDESVGVRSINARVETIAEKPTFRDAFKKRRCLVPADGYYEWQKTGGQKTPMRILPQLQKPFAFAGVWDEWRSPSGGAIRTYSILTTAAHESIRHLHERMPVALHSEMEEPWLDADTPGEDLLAQIPAHMARQFESYPVSPRVNSPRNDDADLIAPVEPPQADAGLLFS